MANVLGNLVPWKKKNSGDIKVRKEEDHPVARLRQEFDQLWDRFWDTELRLWDDARWLGSHIDFHDDEKEYVLRAELPGFEPQDFDVKVSGNLLTVQAEHKEEGQQENGNFQRYGSFYESFTLPPGVLADQIDARYHSGVLEVRLPKDEQYQAKRIEVKSK